MTPGIFDLFKKIESESKPNAPITHLVVGLGNVGSQYEKTRHNAGFIAIDALVESLGVKIDRVKFHATVGEGNIGDIRVLFMKPTTLMNNSGIAVAEAAAFYKIPPENILILHDEISFDVGRMRIRRKGSAGGHNGLKSIIASIGSEDFPRIKIGIGNKPTPEYNLADYVLGKFSAEDLKTLNEETVRITDAAKKIVLGKIDDAMMLYSK